MCVSGAATSPIIRFTTCSEAYLWFILRTVYSACDYAFVSLSTAHLYESVPVLRRHLFTTAQLPLLSLLRMPELFILFILPGIEAVIFRHVSQ